MIAPWELAREHPHPSKKRGCVCCSMCIDPKGAGFWSMASLFGNLFHQIPPWAGGSVVPFGLVGSITDAHQKSSPKRVHRRRPEGVSRFVKHGKHGKGACAQRPKGVYGEALKRRLPEGWARKRSEPIGRGYVLRFGAAMRREEIKNFNEPAEQSETMIFFFV